MKKKLATTLSVVLILGLAVLGILAYLTDSDSDVNVMTVGNVNVDLQEKQRNEEGTALVDFQQGKELTPLVGSAQAEKDKWGQPTAANYVDKIVYAKNTGANDAYIRFLVAIPTALIPDTDDSSNNPLHWNYGNRVDITGEGQYNDVAYADSDWAKQFTYADIETDGNIASVTIEGEEYWVTYFTMQEALAPGADSLAVMSGLYLDSRVDYDADRGVYTFNGTDINYDFSNGVKIPVMVQAVQTAGFEATDEKTAAEVAFEAGFGELTVENAEAWFAGTALATAANSAELAEAVKNGEETVVLSEGTYTLPALKNGEINIIGTGDVTIDLTKATGQNLSGTDLTFSNVTVQGTNENYIGIQHAGNIEYNNVVFNDSMTLYGTSETFNNCIFNLSSRYVWTYGAGEVTFNNCTFNTAGKGILVYNEKAVTSPVQTVNVNNCVFNASEKGFTGSGEWCAAVEVGEGSPFVVNFTGTNTVSGNFSGLYRDKAEGGNSVIFNK